MTIIKAAPQIGYPYDLISITRRLCCLPQGTLIVNRSKGTVITGPFQVRQDRRVVDAAGLLGRPEGCLHRGE